MSKLWKANSAEEQSGGGGSGSGSGDGNSAPLSLLQTALQQQQQQQQQQQNNANPQFAQQLMLQQHLQQMQQQQQQQYQQMSAASSSNQANNSGGSNNNNSSSGNQWVPDAALLQALRAQGPGQYRVRVTTMDPSYYMTPDGRMQMALPPNALSANTYLQQQNGGYVPLDAQRLAMLNLQFQQQQQQMQWQMAEAQMRQQQGQPHLGGMGGPMHGGMAGFPMAPHGYAVDYVNNPDVGADVMLIQAGGAGGSSRRSKRRRPRDPLAPKPGRYAWNFFFKENYKQIRQKDHGGEHFDVQKAFTDIGAALGLRWKALSPEEKQPYVKLAQEDKKRYEREMVEYRRKGAAGSSSNDAAEGSAATAAASEGSAGSSSVAQLAEVAAAALPSDPAVPDAKRRRTDTNADADDEGDEPEAAAKQQEETAEQEDETAEAIAARAAASAAGEALPAAASDEEEEAEEDGAGAQQMPRVNIIRPGEAPPPGTVTEMTADVLVTDDDDTFIMMMSGTLRRLHVNQGYTNLNIHVARNGEEALRKIVDEKQKFAVVTMDKEMGDDLDGVETVKKMREAGYDGVVVGVTGANSAKPAEFDAVGANRTLYKGEQGLFSQVHNIIVENLSAHTKKDAVPAAAAAAVPAAAAPAAVAAQESAAAGAR